MSCCVFFQDGAGDRRSAAMGHEYSLDDIDEALANSAPQAPAGQSLGQSQDHHKPPQPDLVAGKSTPSRVQPQPLRHYPTRGSRGEQSGEGAFPERGRRGPALQQSAE